MTATESLRTGAGLDGELLRDLYQRMLLTRQLDLEFVTMQRQGVLLGYAPLRGQEAAQVGSGAVVDRARDFVFPTYREVGVAVAMDVDVVGYMATHLGVWNGGAYDPIASRFGAVNAVVAGSVLHAVGWAKGEKLTGSDGVALAYFGDGASSQGDVHEAMNFAGVDRLPVVFFCQNNGWAISVPTARQVAGGSVSARAAGYGFPGVRVDGNDVEAVYLATQEAFARARAGEGPTVIEAMTYRSGPHSTSDDPGRYRELVEENSWIERDPITRLALRLREEHAADEAYFEGALAEARAATESIRTGITETVGRPAEEMFDLVFANRPTTLDQQRDLWRAAAEGEERGDD
ncbi:MAG: Pyruvate dehydrogenase (acetyl-transferring) [Naasia sp.]|nr:Pyruvate dehydrogenase (acetyl-transferring) [Naasia sp.]